MASDQQLTDLYATLRASLLARHFALSKYFRGNHFTQDNMLDTQSKAGDILALPDYRWQRRSFGENPLMAGGQLMTCIAVESALGHPYADRIIRSWLFTLSSLYKSNLNHFKGYILRWDPATSDNWTLDANGNPFCCNQFLRDPITGDYQFSPPHNDPRHVPYRNYGGYDGGDESDPPQASNWLQQGMGRLEAKRYIDRQGLFNRDFRRWEPSMDELVGLITGYYMVHKLTQNADNRLEVTRQVNRLGDYLAEHAYLLVRPNGGLTARGSTGILPGLEYPLAQAMRTITGIQYASRKNFQQVMKKAGYWDNLAVPLARWTALGPFAYPVINATTKLVQMLSMQLPVLLIADATGQLPIWVSLKGADLLQKLLRRDSLQVVRIAAIYAHRDCFDMSNNASAEEVAIAFALMENFSPDQSFRLWMYGTSFRAVGGFANNFPWFLGLTGLDGDPLVGDVFLDWYHERQLHPNLDPADHTRALSCFACAVALLLSASPGDETELKMRLDKRFDELSAFNSDLQLEDTQWGVNEKFQPALDFMSGLALAWLYRMRREAAGQTMSTANFPALPTNFPLWPQPAVPESIIKAAKERKIFLPVDSIQKDPNNLKIDSYGAPLFLETDPPHKPELKAPQLYVKPSKLVVDKTFNVRESDRDVITDVVLQNGDVYVIEARGSISAGVAVTGQNGPNGWNDITWDARFPLHGGLDPKNAHSFCLLGRHYGGYFFIGKGGQYQNYIFPLDAALWLRINDDAPGNGNGSFSVRVRVWGAPRHMPVAYRIEGIRKMGRRGRIIALEGIALLKADDSYGATWRMSTAQVIKRIERGQQFFVEGPDHVRARVGVVTKTLFGGKVSKFLRSFHDAGQQNNLGSLPIF